MKTESLQEVATRYNMTLNRAAYDILVAAGEKKRDRTSRIRKQHLPPSLVRKARAYHERGMRQYRAHFFLFKRSWWPMKNGKLTCPLP